MTKVRRAAEAEAQAQAEAERARQEAEARTLLEERLLVLEDEMRRLRDEG
ncbi:hypothetical protein [Roseiflexus sp.]